ncbi:auxin efflux carrier family protein, partial [Lecanoromycetidae sp. Uapishka_2]
MPFFTSPTSFRNANSMASWSDLRMSMMADVPLQSDLLQAQSKLANPPPLHSSHPSLPNLTMLVFEAVLEVVCVSLPGYIVARQGMFTAENQKFAANLNVAVFTPCLIQTLVSFLCAALIAKAFGFSKRPRNFVIAMGVFGNSNSLPISLVLSLSQTIKGLHWTKVPGDNDDEVAARGILYLLIFQQLGQLVRWSWGYNVLLAPAVKVEGTRENNDSRIENGLGGSEEEIEPLLRSSSLDDERDEQNNSGSDDTRVDDGRRGKGWAPSALQLAQICQINNVYMGAMSRLLFQSYVVWILPSTLVLVMCALEVVEWAQR